MDFKSWLLEHESPIKVGGFFKDGTVIIYINGKRYVYMTNPILHDVWKKMARFKPGSVLAAIKKEVDGGRAEWVNKEITL